ncbi:right-handed parallel beta-helix repeat-containing protein [Frigoriglobus tundricola]|uniref:Right handed beta helix domain-containing protein n=1 Tax=Frigoriglobus tundricola TaxID=2774151 RepID=A0A6M5YY14_9BACT|nr:right-handed parallel beta-helix repeat-containing protein [Frigoriglobus tundricola]QJW98370.1 hypothetical protein FTUN_5960 [Frigoriglobus tundricola]
MSLSSRLAARTRPSVRSARAFRPGVEVLEDRLTPTAYTVTNLTDAGSGSGTAGDLRYCITQANADGADDTIAFAPGVTGVVALPASALPDITGRLTIDGAGAIALDGQADVPVLSIDTGATVSLAGLRVSNGGGIRNSGTLSVTNSTIDHNTQGAGGGIFSEGTLSVTNSTIDHNTAQGGGGIFSEGTLSVTNSTIDHNTAPNGGGIFNVGALTVTNSTIADNTAQAGGGISNSIGNEAILNSTISGNSASDQGGGIFSELSTLVLHDTIVAGNSAPNGGPDVDGLISGSVAVGGTTFTEGHNLIGNGSLSSGWAATDLVGANATIDPKLGPLQNNGGPTLTMALLPGSPALDAGGPDATGLPQTDQRGAARVVGHAADIGALELAYRLVATGPPLAAARSVVATDPSGDPLAGISVTFTAPVAPGGPGGTFPGGLTTATVVTGTDGVATSPPFTATGPAGAFVVTAAAGNVSAPFALLNSATVVVTGSDPSPVIGAAETVTVTVTNTGDTVLPAGTATVTLSAGLTPAPGAPLTFDVAPLAPGQSATVSATATATAPGPQIALATLSALDGDGAGATVTVTTPPPAPPAPSLENLSGAVSVAFGPQGEVLIVVDASGLLTQYDATGAHPLATGVRSAGVAFGPRGEVLVVTDQTGSLVQYDASGVHPLADGIVSAAVAFGPDGTEVLDVVGVDGTLTHYDATGAHVLAAGVQSASVAFGARGVVLLVATRTGSVVQYDATGAHVLVAADA